MSVQVKVNGIENVQAMLRDLSNKMNNKILISALRKAVRPMVTMAKRNAPVYKGRPRADVIPGLIKKTQGANRSKIHNGKRGTIGLYIRSHGSKKLKAARRGAARVGQQRLVDAYDPYYYKFQESGFAVGNTKVPGKEFIKKAYEANKMKVINDFSGLVKKEVDKFKAKRNG